MELCSILTNSGTGTGTGYNSHTCTPKKRHWKKHSYFFINQTIGKLFQPVAEPWDYTSTIYFLCLKVNPQETGIINLLRHLTQEQMVRQNGSLHLGDFAVQPHSSFRKVKSLSRAQLFATPWRVACTNSSVHGIFKTRVLEWVAISNSTLQWLIFALILP